MTDVIRPSLERRDLISAIHGGRQIAAYVDRQSYTRETFGTDAKRSGNILDKQEIAGERERIYGRRLFDDRALEWLADLCEVPYSYTQDAVVGLLAYHIGDDYAPTPWRPHNQPERRPKQEGVRQRQIERYDALDPVAAIESQHRAIKAYAAVRRSLEGREDDDGPDSARQTKARRSWGQGS